ncbi:hypothetical protein BKA66DRAFT_511923 [Pyrenochaeta sp. MPI-SDFR-AT-0127]|nr:hypothetical protein BKA66DRAFT_511923 [Pyrenochaeta sp. MPI-SDFR-AT-0127]
MGLLTTTNDATPLTPSIDNDSDAPTVVCSYNAPETAAKRTNSYNSSGLCITPEESPEQSPSDPCIAYDPVDDGLIDQVQANALLDDFRTSLIEQFPFVVLDVSADADTLRQQQPFLFLSIMTATTYKTPTLQHILAEKFRDQVAVRIVGSSHKGLEILQGLLVHAAYYQFFYRPRKQQLAVMLQLCIAMVQDLGQAKNTREHHNKSPTSSTSQAEKRALLGAYYLAAGFAHAWRKRTTMPYTRSLACHCQSLAEHPEYPSDALIAPLVRLSELMCRISEFFSYDEIAYSDISGESTLDLSTTNFRSELQRLQESIPVSVNQNITIRLICDLLGVWIHECSLHASLWQSPQSIESTAITPTRALMLQRTLSAAQSYLRTLIAAPSSSLHHFAFPVWGGWFYSTIVIVKLIFLHDNVGSGALGMDSIPCEIGGMIPQQAQDRPAHDVYKMTASLSANTARDSAMAAREREVIPLFQSFVDKVMAADPSDSEWSQQPGVNLMVMVATLQRSLLAGLRKRIEKQSLKSAPAPAADDFPGVDVYPDGAASVATITEQQYQQPQVQAMDYSGLMDFAYFDHSATPMCSQTQQPLSEDWMWDLVMEDVNIFNM